MPKEATVEVAVTSGTSVAGEAAPRRRLFAGVPAAREAAGQLAGASAADATELYGGSVRLQALAGQVQPLRRVM